MAQAATMGPPLSPREIRRSGRRSAPSASTSASKSPDSDLPPRQKETTQRPLPSSSASARNKKPKDDPEEHGDDRKHATTSAHLSTATANTSTHSKGKRKTKEKDKQRLGVDIGAESLPDPVDEKTTESLEEEEEQGITRCVCGSTGEDETDAGEFMVQCETCKVWQHGLCMGYESEDQVHDADYYCELCRPELHGDLLKKLAKKARHSSTTSHGAVAPRISRSRSPAHLLKQPSKRRNTMNSRDAAFDESLKEIIEATAAEAAAVQESVAQATQANVAQQDIDNDPEVGPNSKKKRKRTEDDATSKKRTRSASSASDQQPTAPPRPPTPPPKTSSQSTTSTTKAPGRNKRTARKNAPITDTPAPPEGDETTHPATTKRQGASNRTRGSGFTKRPPISHINSHGNNNMNHEQGSRRGQPNSTNGHSNSTLESTRSYRNSHAYAVSQQPLFTSWGLPDYLAHLEEMLPTNTPQPLEIQSGGANGAGRESTETTMERGVKVKWPSKRMSVGDMNKRVRSLVEWVGREQANALDRERRRESLEKALMQELESSGKESANTDDNTMVVDGVSRNSGQGKSAADSEHEFRASSTALWKTDEGKSLSTMKMMEELMEELIGFQEKFGPGAKARERERRSAATS